jgi:hypothetical protein
MLPARKRLFIVGCVLAACACLIVWLARESATEKEIKLRLAALRAAGEPTTAQDLARLFPDPPAEEDASLLFGPVFNAVTNAGAGTPNPVAQGNWAQQRGKALHPAALASLHAFVESTSHVTNGWPRVIPPGTRFPHHWERGMTNLSSFKVLPNIRLTTQLLTAHAIYAAEQGKGDVAAELLTMGFQLSASIAKATYMEQMIRQAVDGLLCQTAAQCLSRTSFSTSSVARLSEAIAIESDGAWRDAIRVEHYNGLWAFEDVRNGGRVDYWLGSEREPLWKRTLQWFNLSGKRRIPYRDSDYLFYVRTIPERLRIGSLPASQIVGASERDRATYSSNMVSELGEAVYPWYPRTVRAHVETSARRVVLKTALAVEQYSSVKPTMELKGLNELVPAFLPHVPPDPFDTKPLRYKKLPRGYVVYSIGADGVDNGGLERTNSGMTANYDVTFTVER